MIKVWFNGCGMVPELSQERTEFVTSASTTPQKCWKNKGGMPSGPEALRGAIFFKASFTSKAVKVSVKASNHQGNVL